MICLNSIIELIGRISTMLRMLRASTPVESFCEVVRIVGMRLLVVLEVAQVLLAELAVVGRDALAVVRVGARLHLVDAGRARRAAWSCVAQKTSVFSRWSIWSMKSLHAVRLALLDLDDSC